MLLTYLQFTNCLPGTGFLSSLFTSKMNRGEAAILEIYIIKRKCSGRAMKFDEFDSDFGMKMQQHYKISTADEMFEISENAVRKWLKCKKIKGHKIGGAARIPKSELIKLIQDWTNYNF